MTSKSPFAVVVTTRGRLRGIRCNGVTAFKGIAYAAETGGRNRFQPPQPLHGWTGVKDAFEFGDRSPQTYLGYNAPLEWYDQDCPAGEDCCFLNVFAPDAESGARRPVMVFIHGGGYANGGGNPTAMHGSCLARAGDVVVVTLNHRLNIFGYANFGALDGGRFSHAANAGQLDIIAALTWIRDNIAAVGGDADCVTLFGQSGGGSKIMTLMAMPEAKGLFHRAINMSGGTIWGQDPASDSDDCIGRLLRTLQIDPCSLGKLCAVSVEDLLRARSAVKAESRYEFSRPVIDGNHIPAALFSPDGLEVHASVPLLMGVTNTEATFYFHRDRRNFWVTEEQLLDRLCRQFSLEMANAKSIVAAYRHDDPTATAADVLIQIASDVRFRGPILQGAEKKASAKSAPVYHYSFVWDAPADGGVWRAPHAIDLPFVFGTTAHAVSLVGTGNELPRVTGNLMAACLAFARTGTPANSLARDWKPYEPTDRTTMTIGLDCEAVSDFRKHGREASLHLLGPVGPALDQGPLFNYSD
jgi:para-nitrobenzyl esterase